LFPKTFVQQTSPLLTQMSPQHWSPFAHSKLLPWWFLHVTDAFLHVVALLTGYHPLFGPWGLQHLLPGA